MNTSSDVVLAPMRVPRNVIERRGMITIVPGRGEERAGASARANGLVDMIAAEGRDIICPVTSEACRQSLSPQARAPKARREARAAIDAQLRAIDADPGRLSPWDEVN